MIMCPSEIGIDLQFDGEGGVLAHAFFPSKRKTNPHPVTGDVHLDLDENWVTEGKIGLSFSFSHPVTGDVHLDLDEKWVTEGKVFRAFLSFFLYFFLSCFVSLFLCFLLFFFFPSRIPSVEVNLDLDKN